jgi:hypothetical protein
MDEWNPYQVPSTPPQQPPHAASLVWVGVGACLGLFGLAIATEGVMGVWRMTVRSVPQAAIVFGGTSLAACVFYLAVKWLLQSFRRPYVATRSARLTAGLAMVLLVFPGLLLLRALGVNQGAMSIPFGGVTVLSLHLFVCIVLALQCEKWVADWERRRSLTSQDDESLR